MPTIKTRERRGIISCITDKCFQESQKQTNPSKMKDMSMTVLGECYSMPVMWGGGGGGARVAINDEFAR